MTALFNIILQSLTMTTTVDCASIFNFPGELLVDGIAPYLSTVDLQSLLQTTSSMKVLLSHLIAQRHSMILFSVQ